RVDFGYQIQPLAVIAADGLADQMFGRALAVHFGGIDQRHAGLDARAQGAALLCEGIGVLAQIPGPLADAPGRGADMRAEIHAYPPLRDPPGACARFDTAVL